jgi:hypothetical protein
MKVLAEAKGYDVTCGRYRTLKRAKGIGNAAGVDWGSEKFERALKYVCSIPARVQAGKFEAKVAAAKDWNPWDPGIDVTRTRAKFEEGSRFDG